MFFLFLFLPFISEIMSETSLQRYYNIARHTDVSTLLFMFNSGEKGKEKEKKKR